MYSRSTTFQDVIKCDESLQHVHSTSCNDANVIPIYSHRASEAQSFDAHPHLEQIYILQAAARTPKPVDFSHWDIGRCWPWQVKKGIWRFQRDNKWEVSQCWIPNQLAQRDMGTHPLSFGFKQVIHNRNTHVFSILSFLLLWGLAGWDSWDHVAGSAVCVWQHSAQLWPAIQTQEQFPSAQTQTTCKQHATDAHASNHGSTLE